VFRDHKAGLFELRLVLEKKNSDKGPKERRGARDSLEGSTKHVAA